jgi:hypothetical protein
MKLMAGIFVVALLTGCGGKSQVDDSIAQIEKAIEKLEEKKTGFTEEDMTAFSEEIKEPVDKLMEALENDRVGTIKKLKIVALMGKMISVAGKAGFDTIVDETVKKLQETNTDVFTSD